MLRAMVLIARALDMGFTWLFASQLPASSRALALRLISADLKTL
jgi:hypothetical protein